MRSDTADNRLLSGCRESQGVFEVLGSMSAHNGMRSTSNLAAEGVGDLTLKI